MAGEQSELAPDVSETREKVWANDDYSTLHDNSDEPSAAPRKQPEAISPESGTQAQPGRTV